MSPRPGMILASPQRATEPGRRLASRNLAPNCSVRLTASPPTNCRSL
ncbi:hypothetical protein PspLS_08072 [Pyricularia sp. CBS 133598]|nr:hypothetical protein PspLS_08072 [Pyricularia sp. CBS 133598]